MSSNKGCIAELLSLLIVLVAGAVFYIPALVIEIILFPFFFITLVIKGEGYKLPTGALLKEADKIVSQIAKENGLL